MMFSSYFKATLRNLLRNKLFSFINIAGLAFGMACTLMILLWVQNESGYDAFHRNATDIYRVMSYGSKYFQDGIDGTPGPLAPAIEEAVPHVKSTTRVADIPRVVFKHEDRVFFEERGVAVDPSFLEMFTFPLIHGTRETALSDPLNIVLVETTARRYFGDTDPLGRTLTIEGQPARVSGVLRDIPANSHLRFDYLIPFAGMDRLASWGTHWGAFNFVTYLQLHGNADTTACAEKITAVANEHNCPQVKDGVRFRLQPLHDIHLDGRGAYRNFADVVDGKYVTIFSVIGLLVLLLACANFMNLSTARSVFRSREVGMRKVLGAGRRQVIVQFLVESFMLALIALTLAVILVEFLTPTFNRIASRQLSVDYLQLSQILGTTGLVLLTGLAAGLYPALHLSHPSPIEVLRGIHANPGKRGILRKAMVVAQFTITVILLIATTVLYRQMNFIQHRNLGFQKDNVVVLPLKKDIGGGYAAIKTELLRHANITGVTAAHYFFPQIIPRTTDYDWEGRHPDQRVDMLINAVGHDFFTTLAIDTLAGRTFSPRFPSDEDQAYILNEKAVAAMGITDPVGKKFSYNRREGTIIGVVRNSHFKSLHEPIEPHVFVLATDHSDASQYGAIFIRIKPGGIEPVLSTIENLWNRVEPGTPFEPRFLDQAYENQYRNEMRIRTILDTFTGLALLISCLGLFGLTSFLTERRTKEIGIRKTLGASIVRILLLLSQDFLKWVLLAGIIAAPFAHVITNQLLSVYAYRTPSDVRVYLFAGCLAFGSAMLTIAARSVRAARANPVEALKYE